MNAALAAWAGFGLLFVGVRLIGLHVQPLIGGRLSRLISASLSRPVLPRAAGFASGALTSSAGAVVFVSAGLVSAGAATLAQTLPLLAWANVGTSTLVLVAAVDLRSLALLLFGAVGLGFFAGWDRRERVRHALLAVLGVTLLIFGLSLMKATAASLRGDVMAEEFFTFAGSSVAVGYMVGLVLSAVLQSSSIVTVMTLPLLQSGVLVFADVVPLVYGACLGSGVSVLLLASGTGGPAGQLALCQAGMRLLASAAVLLLLLLERATGLPLVVATIEHALDSEPLRAGVLFLFFQCMLVLASWRVSGRLAAFAERLLPSAASESARRPQYLFEGGSEDPETALAMAGLETTRLVAALPEYLDGLREAEAGGPAALGLAERHAASTALAASIEAFLATTLEANPQMADVERLFRLRARIGAIGALQGSLHEFAQGIGAVPVAQRPPVAASMTEALHAILMTAALALQGTDDEDEWLFRQLTGERGAVMDVVRKALLELPGGHAEREALQAATFAFERVLWQLRSLPGAQAA